MNVAPHIIKCIRSSNVCDNGFEPDVTGRLLNISIGITINSNWTIDKLKQYSNNTSFEYVNIDIVLIPDQMSIFQTYFLSIFPL